VSAIRIDMGRLLPQRRPMAVHHPKNSDSKVERSGKAGILIDAQVSTPGQ
jgi:hypothetical protein